MTNFDIFVAVIVLFASSFTPLNAQERTKTFPNHHYRYTLPGDDWAWDDAATVSNSDFVALHKSGVIVWLIALPAPSGRKVDQPMVAKFEQSLYSDPGIKKRGGEFLNFKELPCYQAYASLTNTNKAAFLFFMAHGLEYHFQILGREPVEKRADFEKIMNGFEFTTPPVEATRGYGSTFWIVDHVAQVVCILLSLAILAWRIRLFRGKLSKKKKNRKEKPRPVDDDVDKQPSE